MKETQAQDGGNEFTEQPGSSPSPSPSRKRLHADPKPKLGFTASSDSALSSDSSSDRFGKKTRDLPNLSDCHGCGVRVNNTNPKDKLQTLGSAWRVVLLCRKCIKRVESAELCSYCLLEASAADGDCFRCQDCGRYVHRGCVVQYRCSAPWSYCCLDSTFSVCIDCWVPELLANSNRDYRKKSNKTIVSKSCSMVDSRVSAVDSGRKSLEDMAKVANCELQKKIAAATKAKENALRKAVVAKRAIEIATGALGLVGKSESPTASSCSGSATTALDDAKLAFQLHRAMNCSPRISRNLGSMNSTRFDASKVSKCNDYLTVPASESRGSPSSSVCGKLTTCTTNKVDESLLRTMSEPSVCVRVSGGDSFADLDYFKPGNMVNITNSSGEKECQENVKIGLDVDVNEKYHSVDGSMKNSEFLCRHNQEELGHELDPTYAKTPCQSNCDKNDSMLHDERCNVKPRYLITYSKRPRGSKRISNHETKFLCGNFDVESKAVAPGLPLSCSKESRTAADASFQHCVPLQAPACGSDSYREQL